jgi:hypothetical protein
MKKTVLGILIVLVFLASPCAADTVSLTAGQSCTWNLTSADYVFPDPTTPWLNPYVAEVLSPTSDTFDLMVSLYDHASSPTPFYTGEIGPTGHMGDYTWYLGMLDYGVANIDKVLDNDLSVKVMLVSGSVACQGPTVQIVNTDAPVPVPPTVWLLGSGLLGLVGWRRISKS